jgi:hypothetical protein
MKMLIVVLGARDIEPPVWLCDPDADVWEEKNRDLNDSMNEQSRSSLTC